MIFNNSFNIQSALKNEPFFYIWGSCAKDSIDFKKTFTDELGKELYMGHPLYGLEVEIIARGASDDCLFKMTHSNQVCVVHLTWKQATEIPPYPLTQIYESLDYWYETDYIPDFFKILGLPINLSFFEQNVIGYAIGFITSLDFESYLYTLDSKECLLTDDEYLSFISLNFDNRFEVLIAFNQWFRKNFNDARYDLLEMNKRFNK
jgi:hypothetical protein